MTHSLSVLSDALESIVNVLAGAIGLYSLYVASKPKDKEHPYGHGKAEFISAAFANSIQKLRNSSFSSREFFNSLRSSCVNFKLDVNSTFKKYQINNNKLIRTHKETL